MEKMLHLHDPVIKKKFKDVFENVNEITNEKEPKIARNNDIVNVYVEAVQFVHTLRSNMVENLLKFI